MQDAFIVEPNYRNSAHHIVMSNSQDVRMRWLRSRMDRLGIDKNSAVNGAYLPTSSSVKDVVGTSAHAHSKVHTDTYKQNVFDRLKNITNKTDFENELMNIGDELSSGIFGI